MSRMRWVIEQSEKEGFYYPALRRNEGQPKSFAVLPYAARTVEEAVGLLGQIPGVMSATLIHADGREEEVAVREGWPEGMKYYWGCNGIHHVQSAHGNGWEIHAMDQDAKKRCVSKVETLRAAAWAIYESEKSR